MVRTQHHELGLQVVGGHHPCQLERHGNLDLPGDHAEVLVRIFDVLDDEAYGPLVADPPAILMSGQAASPSVSHDRRGRSRSNLQWQHEQAPNFLLSPGFTCTVPASHPLRPSPGRRSPAWSDPSRSVYFTESAAMAIPGSAATLTLLLTQS